MTEEIERKFLVNSFLDSIEDFPKQEIMQGYLQSNNPELEERVRKANEEYFHTIKSVGTLSREEREERISKSDFEFLWPLTERRRIKKTRYKIPGQDFTIEVDVYRGDLEGLIIAEVEFTSLEGAEEFQPLPWFGIEVTEDKRYKNFNLAVYGLPK
jgi:CYTH domain-containing protein